MEKFLLMNKNNLLTNVFSTCTFRKLKMDRFTTEKPLNTTIYFSEYRRSQA